MTPKELIKEAQEWEDNDRWCNSRDRRLVTNMKAALIAQAELLERYRQEPQGHGLWCDKTPCSICRAYDAIMEDKG